MQSISAALPAGAPAPGAFADRKPPYSPEAEISVLGGMLIDADAIVRVLETLDDSMFYREGNRRLFRAMVRLWEQGEVIDAITLAEELKNTGDFEAVGGTPYLAQLLDAVPTAANIEYHARIVREKAILRRLIEAATGIIQQAFADQGQIDELLDRSEQQIFQIAQTHDRRGFVWIKEILWPTFERIEALQANPSAITGVPTGFHDLDDKTAGFQAGDLIIIAARPSMGKCLAHDAEIVLGDGSIATIEEIYRRREGPVLTLDDDWRFGWTEPSAFVDDGEKPVFRVTTRFGRSIETTLTHPYLTLEGWKPLAELKVGDAIAVPRTLTVFGTDSLRDCEVKLLAYLIGDGGLTDTVPEFTSGNPRVREDFARAVREFGGGQLQAAGPTLAMESEDIVVPSVVFRLRRAQVALFLNRLFAADGWATVLSSGQPQLGYATVSQRLARQVQHLLLRFGVIASLRERRVRYDGGPRRSWQLDITDAASITTFIREIGIFGKEEALSDAAAALGDASVHPPAKGEVYWDEIVAIEPVGMKQVYDLTIPGTHNFVANDICVHNTAFTLNIAQHAAIRAQQTVAVFSLEMSKEALVQRVLCAEGRVDASRMRTGRLRDDEYHRLAVAAGFLNTAPIYIDDTPAISVLEMRAKARRLKADRPDLAMVIVDYLQLMRGPGRSESRQQEVSEISRGLKALAKELDLPVVALSQLSRAVEQRPDKRPMMSDLRESGAIEQDADVIMFLYRPEYYYGPVDKDGQNLEGRAELIIGKQRNGATGRVELLFQKEFTRFESFSPREDGGP